MSAQIFLLQTCLAGSCSSRVAVLTEVQVIDILKANHITAEQHGITLQSGRAVGQGCQSRHVPQPICQEVAIIWLRVCSGTGVTHLSV